MKKYISLITFLLMFVLVGCTDLVNQIDESDEIDETVINNGCTYSNLDSSPLVGFSEYSNISRAPFCEEYSDILIEFSTKDGFMDNTIIYHDENELVFLNGNGVYYRYKNSILEEHDVYYNINNSFFNTPGILGYNPSNAILYAIKNRIEVSGNRNITHIMKYNMDTQEAMQLPIALGRDPQFVHAGTKGYAIESWDKLFIFDHHFELIKESTDEIYLGSSKYQENKDNEVILIGKNLNNSCEVTLFRGDFETKTILEDSCSSVQRLSVYSKFVYFVINKKLYRFDAENNNFSIVTLSVENEVVDYIATKSINTTNQINALKLSKNMITYFNKNMDITQSTNAVEVFQVGETFYLANKPNSNDNYVYNFDKTEALKIEEDFAYTSMSYNFLVLNKQRCELMYCQNIYKNGVELVLSDVMMFNAIDYQKALYADQVTDSSYDIMHINFETNVTKKIMTLDYSTSPVVNYSAIVTLPNGMFIVRDSYTGFYHHYDSNGDFIEKTTYIGYFKTISGASIIYLLRDNGEVISLSYFF